MIFLVFEYCFVCCSVVFLLSMVSSACFNAGNVCWVFGVGTVNVVSEEELGVMEEGITVEDDDEAEEGKRDGIEAAKNGEQITIDQSIERNTTKQAVQ